MLFWVSCRVIRTQLAFLIKIKAPSLPYAEIENALGKYMTLRSPVKNEKPNIIQIGTRDKVQYTGKENKNAKHEVTCNCK